MLDISKLKQLIKDTDDVNKMILTNLLSSIYEIIDNEKINDIEDDKIIKEKLTSYEKKVYGNLTDRQIINYEIKRIKKEYDSKINCEENDDATLHLILVLIEFYISNLLANEELGRYEKKDLQVMRKQIAYIEALLNMKNGLYYETYHHLVEQFDRIYNLTYQNKKHYR